MFSELFKKSLQNSKLALQQWENLGGIILKGTPQDAKILKEQGMRNLFVLLEIHINNQADFDYFMKNFKDFIDIKTNFSISKEILVNMPKFPEFFEYGYDIEIYGINELNFKQLELLEKEGKNLNKIYLKGFNSHYSYTARELIELKKRINEITLCVNMQKSEVERFLKIYEIIGKNVEYEKGKQLEDALRYKRACCQGYSELLNLMLDGVGIKSITIMGNYKNEHEGHDWNQVQIDGKWYNCDLTWDSDRMRNGEIVKYCLRNDAFFKKDDDHIPQNGNERIYVVNSDYNQEIIKNFFENDIER